MFRKAILTYHSNVDSDNSNVEIIDTDFGSVHVKTPNKYHQSGICIRREVSIIGEYSRRGLPVAPCLARQYLTYETTDLPRILQRDKEALDELAPELEYSTKYYQCVLGQ